MIKFSLGLALILPVQAFTIQVDYRFDTQGFFDNPDARVALEAAAARWSRIIDQELLAVDIQDEAGEDTRFSLNHPETGSPIQLSAAESAGSDYIVTRFNAPVADFYLGGFTLEADTWVLFVGTRSMSNIAVGGPIFSGIGVEDLTLVPDSLFNRGFNEEPGSLNVLGGVVSFDRNTNWSFSLTDSGTGGGIDFYTVALHEIGHGLGLASSGAPRWQELSDSGLYTGVHALDAYEADNGERLAGLELGAGNDPHWRTNIYGSAIFPFGVPNSIGVASGSQLQPLLMESALRVSSSAFRLEVTNVEVGALMDLGWSVISEDPPEPPRIPLVFERSVTGQVKLGIPSQEGSFYTVQTSSDGIIWQNVTPSLSGDGSMLCWEDGQEGFVDPSGNAADLNQKFYRVREDDELLPVGNEANVE